MESILTSIKKLLGVDEQDTSFDVDITMFINSALMRATQLGVGPSTGFRITDKTATWDALLGTREDLEAVKSFIYMKVKLVFDPPQSSFVLEAYKQEIKEAEWCLTLQTDIVVPIEGGEPVV